MRNKRTILFDLDGTLIDPKEGITKSAQFALQQMGIVVEDLDNLQSFIGPPLQTSFKERFQFSDEEVQEAIAFYRERYKPIGIYENKVYEGIIPLLEQLKTEGYQLAIATSKATVFAKEIAKHYEFEQYFDCIMGSELDGRRILKAEVIEEVLRQLHITDVSHCIMVGDRMYDIIGANTNKMDSIGVLFGYGEESELNQAGASYIVKSVEELGSLLRRL